jgi:hypothetical protein
MAEIYGGANKVKTGIAIDVHYSDGTVKRSYLDATCLKSDGKIDIIDAKHKQGNDLIASDGEFKYADNINGDPQPIARIIPDPNNPNQTIEVPINHIPMPYPITSQTTFTPNEQKFYFGLRNQLNGQGAATITKVDLRSKKLKDWGDGSTYLKGTDILPFLNQPVKIFTNTNSTTDGNPVEINY